MSLNLNLPQTNFAHLKDYDEQLLRLGLLAEKYFREDPNTCLLKLRQFAELLAQTVASRVGLFASADEAQYKLLQRLQDQGILPRDVAQLFREIKFSGNAANHALIGDHRTALANLKIAWQLGLWFHRTFRDPAFKSGPFIAPVAAKDESEELRTELERLAQSLADYQATHQDKTQRLAQMEASLKTAQDEQLFWEQMAVEAEQAKERVEQQLAKQQASSESQPNSILTHYTQAANRAAESVLLDEASTRKLIDHQLSQVGWEVDSEMLTYEKGIRPEKGKNRAIAE